MVALGILGSNLILPAVEVPERFLSLQIMVCLTDALSLPT